MRSILILGIVAATIVGVVTVVLGDDPPDRYVPQTGHTIDSRFVSFYDNHGGARIIGHPISKFFQDPITRLQVQYFQNARLELVPDDEGGLEVQFAPLGQMLYGWMDHGEESNPPDLGCKFFPDTRFSVCHFFLDFFVENEGVEVFGSPISSQVFTGDQLVQTFQNFRFEYNFTAAPGEEFRLTALGQIHFDQSNYNRDHLDPHSSDESPSFIIEELHLETSVNSPLLEPGVTQTVYVTVRDEQYNPIRDAATLLIVHSSTDPRYLLLPGTNENGATFVELDIDKQPSGSEVILEFLVMYGDLYAVARDSFIIR